MRVLIISRSFYPIISPRSFRTTELVNELCRLGNKVTLLTSVSGAEQKHISSKLNLEIRSLGPLMLKPVGLVKPGTARTLSRLRLRILNLLFQYPDIQLMWAVRNALRNLPEYDILISIAAPHSIHWGVAWVRNNTRRIAKTWIADCGDPFMGQENDTFRPLFYFKWLEKWFCHKADFISVPLKSAIAGYYPEFHHKIKVIPQGFDFSTTPVWKGQPENKVPTFAYAGGFIPAIRDPRPILEFLLACDLDFRFHIYTRQEYLVDRYARSSNGKVIVHQVIPREELIFELSRMDFLLNIENAGAIQLPSKLIDYAIAGRPVLSVNSNALDQQKFRNFLNRDYRGQLEMTDVDIYRIENVVAQFLKCHEENRS